MKTKIQKSTSFKLWLAVFGLALFGFVLMLGNAPKAHSINSGDTSGYICQAFPEIMSGSASLSVTNNRTGVTSTVNSYSSAPASPGTLNIYSGDSLTISFSGGVSPSDGNTLYLGTISLNNTSSSFGINTAQPISYGPVTTGGFIEFDVSECNTSANASVNINIVTPPPTLTFWASATTVYTDQTPTLYWKSTGAYAGTNCSAGNSWGGAKGSDSGVQYSQPVGPYPWAGTATYSLQCLGPGGWSATQTVNINVITRPTPTATISAASTSIPYNTGTTINWSSNNTSRCEVKKDGVLVSGWTATTDSKLTGNLTAASTYSVTCYNEIGTASNSPSVTVNVGAAPDISVTCTPSYLKVAPGSSTSFSLSSTSLNGFTGPVTWSTASAIPTGTSLVYGSNGSSLVSGGSATTLATFTAGLTTPANIYSFVFSTTSSVASKSCPAVQLEVLPRPTVTISASDNGVVEYNTAGTVTWSSSNATACTVTKAGAAFATGISGSQTTGPLTSNTSFAVSCTGSGGTSDTVTVTFTPLPYTSIVAATNPVVNGGSTTITWNSSLASTCTVRKAGTVWYSTLSGSQTSGALTAPTTFHLSCTNSAGSAASSVTVNIIPTGTISASPNPVNYNGSSTITWSSTNATSCNVTSTPSGYNWSGTSGSQIVYNLTSSRSFTVNCSGAGGSSTPNSVTVNLTSPDLSLNCSPVLISVAAGQVGSYSLTATSLNGFSGAVTWSVIGSLPSGVTTDYIYNGSSLTVGGSATTIANIYVGINTPATTYPIYYRTTSSIGTKDCATVLLEVPPKPIGTISASPNPVNYNSASTITWSSTNATSCNVTKDGAAFASGLSGSQSSGSLTASSTFTLVCYGAGGTSTPVSVTVTLTPQDMSVSCTPVFVQIQQGSYGSFALTATSVNGFTGTVGWSSSSTLAKGATLSIEGFQNTVPLNSSTTLIGNISATTTATPGTYGIIFTANSSVGVRNCALVQYQIVALPTVTISASPNPVNYNSASTITWSSTNADTCSVTKAGSAFGSGTSGSLSSGNLIADTTFIATCTGAGGSALASVKVSVKPNLIAPTSLVATPTCSGITFSWSYSRSGSDPTNFKISYSTSPTFPVASTEVRWQNFDSSNTSRVFSYNHTSPTSGVTYYYKVGAYENVYNTLVESGYVSTMFTTCKPNFDSSDKDLVGLTRNGRYLAFDSSIVACSGKSESPSATDVSKYSGFQEGDVVRFRIAICNGGTATSSSIAITDTLNDAGNVITLKSPSIIGFSPTSCGSLVGDTLLSYAITSIEPQSSCNIIMEAVVQKPPSAISGSLYRFQNDATIVTTIENQSVTKMIQTLPFLFQTGGGPPIREEISP